MVGAWGEQLAARLRGWLPFQTERRAAECELLGKDIAPESQVGFAFDANGGTSWDFEFEMGEEFKPFPGYLEFKQGAARVRFDGSLYHLDLDGGLRALRLPNLNLGGVPDWVIDEDVAISVEGPDLEFSLREEFNLPAQFASAGPLALRFGTGGDVRFTFNLAQGATFAFDSVQLYAFGSQVLGSMDATVNSSGVAMFSETDIARSARRWILAGDRERR